MDLGKAGIGKSSAAFKSAVCGANITSFCVRREKENSGITTGPKYDRIRRMSFDLSGNEIPSDNPARNPIGDY